MSDDDDDEDDNDDDDTEEGSSSDSDETEDDDNDDEVGGVCKQILFTVLESQKITYFSCLFLTTILDGKVQCNLRIIAS